MAQLNDNLKNIIFSELGSGLQNLAKNKLIQLNQRQPTNPLFSEQQSPAQQTLQSLLGGGQTITPTTPQTQSILEGLQQFKPANIQMAEEQTPEYKALGIKEKPARKLQPEKLLTPAEKRETHRQKIAEEKAAHAEKLAERKAEHARSLAEQKIKKPTAAEQKSLQAYADKIAGFKKVSQDQGLTLDRMEQLIDEGGLPIAAFYSLFKNLEEEVNPVHAGAAGSAIGGGIGAALGGPVGAAIGGTIGGVAGGLVQPVATMLRYAQRATSPNTEEFEKLSSSFIRGVKEIFGNRILKVDIEEFLKTIPTLANTDHGKKQIIKNMRLFLKANNYRYKALRQVIAKNKGEIPKDAEFQVDKIAGPKIKQLAKHFKTGLPKKE